MSLQLEHDAHDGIHVVAVSGELDVAGAAEVRTALALATSGRAGALVLDLSDVSFIDSTGLGTLLRADDRLRADGVRMIVVCPPGPVQRLLAMTRLDGHLALEGDRPAALARARTASSDAVDG
ncbi:MAG TPA: STAS domain-containing protein [Solirubrobacteraceae bacterium]|nr:STAS domain-containing protein [Solirubrobacteraceae bacterium]